MKGLEGKEQRHGSSLETHSSRPVAGACLRLPYPGRAGGTRSHVTSPPARFVVCGHWPGAQPQAFLEKLEKGGPNPNHKSQTTGRPFSLTSSHRTAPQGRSRPTEHSLGSLPQEVRLQEMSFLLFPLKRLYPTSPSRVTSRPSTSHHSSELESLVSPVLRALSHLSVQGREGGSLHPQP